MFGLIGKGAYFYVQNDPVLPWGDWLCGLHGGVFRGGLGQLPVTDSSLRVTCAVKILRKVLAPVVVSFLRKRM